MGNVAEWEIFKKQKEMTLRESYFKLMKKTHKDFSVETARTTFRSQIQRKTMTFNNKNIDRYILKGLASTFIYIPTDNFWFKVFIFIFFWCTRNHQLKKKNKPNKTWTESQNGWDWMESLEVIWSNPQIGKPIFIFAAKPSHPSNQKNKYIWVKK